MSRQIQRWFLVAALVLVGTVGAWAAYSVATSQPDAQMRFAGSMPSGALVYLEARDLSGMMRTWNASETRSRYYTSASYRSFRRSRLYLKLQDRLSDLQKGFGFELTEERLAEFAGGRSAVAIYDPGKLEVLLTTEVSREKAITTVVFAQAKNFEERRTPKGALYYAREVSTDGGNLVQRIAFAHQDGKLWIGTSEALLAEALDGPANQGLGASVGSTLQTAADFSAHDLSIWFDMDRVLKNKYFNLYWIQRNAKSLEGITAGLVDVEFARDGVHERRWYVRRDAAPSANSAATDFASLNGMAPGSAQLVDVRTVDSALYSALSETMFGSERGGSDVAKVGFRSVSNPFAGDEDESGDDATPLSGKYRYLDQRFDLDVDDPVQAKAAVASGASANSGPSFAQKLDSALTAASPTRYATYASIDLPEGHLFASFDRTVVIDLGAPERFDAKGFEQLITTEFGRRFVVGGDASSVVWKDDGGARAISGALIPQGGAYRLGGKYLVIGRDAARCSQVLEFLGGPKARGGFEAPKGTVVRVAEVRLANARDSFARLTGLLDSRSASSIYESVSDAADGEESNSPVMFFSQNITSLLAVARDVSVVRIVTTEDGVVMRERVDYQWGGM